VSRLALQRRCACGGTPGPDGECAACKAKRLHREIWPPESLPGDEQQLRSTEVAATEMVDAGKFLGTGTIHSGTKIMPMPTMPARS
jgi:hypothetical protein